MFKTLLRRWWDDDGGALIAIEFLFIAVILVIGLIVGLVTLRNAINTELVELANAILALNPGYGFSGLTGCCAFTNGSEADVIPIQVPFPICTPPAFPMVITPPIPCM